MKKVKGKERGREVKRGLKGRKGRINIAGYSNLLGKWVGDKMNGLPISKKGI